MIEDERNREVVVGLLVRIVENCRGRMGCRTLIVDLEMKIILRSSVCEHRVVAILVFELWCFYQRMMVRTAENEIIPGQRGHVTLRRLTRGSVCLR